MYCKFGVGGGMLPASGGGGGAPAAAARDAPAVAPVPGG